jgi:hypothetical protein
VLSTVDKMAARSLAQWAQATYQPTVMVASSPDVDRICRKNGVDLAQLLRPLGLSLETVGGGWPGAIAPYVLWRCVAMTAPALRIAWAAQHPNGTGTRSADGASLCPSSCAAAFAFSVQLGH